jgi:formate dehydrogenase subunit gamma
MANSSVQARALAASNADEILRFHRSERHLHWAIAIPFTVCYLTAAILVLVYNAHPVWPLRAVFSWTHRIAGGCLIVLPPLAVARHWRDFRLHVQNVRWGWRWTLDDVKWLLLMGPATFCSRIALPHQGKFNAGEKINFVVIMCTYPIYVATGLTIWFAGVPFVSWLVHVFLAVFVATPLLLGHVFMALVNPDTRVGLSGMLSGLVDRHWARHHYRYWYDQTFGELAAGGDMVVEAEAPTLDAVALENDSSAAVARAKSVSPLSAPWPRLPGQVLGLE